MAINSRSKGNRNERKVAALLKQWTKKDFAKTPASGGLRWKTAMSKGDVICTKEGHYFPFCVEVKAHKEIDFSHLLVPGIKNIKIMEFWEQCSRDANDCNKVPLLLMRYDRLPGEFFFAVIPTSFYHKFNKLYWLGKKTLSYWDKSTDLKLTFLSSVDLFAMPYKEIKSLAKTYLKNGKKEKR